MKILPRIIVVFIIVLGVLGGVQRFNHARVSKDNTTVSKKISVIASFYPLYFFTKEIGKDLVEVKNLTPAGAEPHDYEPTTQDLTAIGQSNIIVINGVGFEPWADKIKQELNDNTVLLPVSESFSDLNLEENGESIRDPHVWLNPLLAKKEVQQITTALIDVDPRNEAYYLQNSNQLQKKLEELDREFRQGLITCKQKNIVTSHAAFGYLAREYGLTQISISGISPDEEPSPQKLADVADFIKREHISSIFFESIISPRLAETVAAETGANVLLFDPLEGLSKQDELSGKDYFSVQKENLKNLRIALQCN